ncbi:phosphatase PAP2 family protein, partial [Mesorhizobium sp. M2E.F.Ca.ET.219.01.1.1]|uniref:phosphatase PAP2 family protein n=1 Tax=Mesorhizobium sp. M2E.F.Ca.ET.219.01.1.1 TaxID=2500530 RepID=UPI001093B6B9
SDHATASMAIVAAFAMHALQRRTLVLFAAALLICWSRLHIGIHYAGDVVGGAVTGLAAALAVRLSYRENSRLDAFAMRIFRLEAKGCGRQFAFGHFGSRSSTAWVMATVAQLRF